MALYAGNTGTRRRNSNRHIGDALIVERVGSLFLFSLGEVKQIVCFVGLRLADQVGLFDGFLIEIRPC